MRNEYIVVRLGLVLLLGGGGAACASQDVEYRGYGAWADDGVGMALVTERLLVERAVFDSEGSVESVSFELWVQPDIDGEPNRLLSEREGNTNRVYFMKQAGYVLLYMSDGSALMVSFDDGVVTEVPRRENEVEFVPSRDGTVIGSVRVHECTDGSPRTCEMSVVFRDSSTLDVIEETAAKPLVVPSRELIRWTSDGAAVLTDGSVAYMGFPGDGDDRMPVIEVPCLWLPTSSDYVNTDGMFIEVDVEDGRPIVQLAPTDDPIARCPVP